jgi:hypothetical protein
MMISPINTGSLRNYVSEMQKKMCDIKDEAGNIIGKYYEREGSATPPIIQLCPDPIDKTYTSALLYKNFQNALSEARKQYAK